MALGRYARGRRQPVVRPCARRRTGSPARARGRAGSRRSARRPRRPGCAARPASGARGRRRSRSARQRGAAAARRPRRRSALPAAAARRPRRPAPAARRAARRRRRGSVSVKTLPSPGALCTVMSPPSRRARSREIDRPRPVPPYLRCVLPSAWRKASKMTPAGAAAMPMPVSRTANDDVAVAGGGHAQRDLARAR